MEHIASVTIQIVEKMNSISYARIMVNVTVVNVNAMSDGKGMLVSAVNPRKCVWIR